MLNRLYRWFFENRQTGAITIAQPPNLPLGSFFLATLVRIVAPAGIVQDAAMWIAVAALLWWAIDELFRGVNPWRRLLGAAALAWQAARLFR